MDEFSTACIKLIKTDETCEAATKFWFDNPLRFGLWGYLKERLPGSAAQFATCETKAIQPQKLIIAPEAILLSDLFLTDSFGLVVFGSVAKSNFGESDSQEKESLNEVSILVRVFAPASIEPEDVCKIVDLNILAMCVKQLISEFTDADLWRFEPVGQQTKQSVRLNRIESRSSDSGGALVRAAREFIDITANFTVLEYLPEDAQSADWIE